MSVMNSYLNTPWLMVRQPNRWADLRLFCFPYSGAGATIFTRWSERLPYGIELCAIQLPGRENRLSEPLHTRIRPVVEQITEVLESYLDKPFAFFGHSLGSLIGFEVLRRLHDEYGATPQHFFAAGHGAPQLPRTRSPIHHLPDAEFTEELRRYNGTPEAVLANRELRQLLYPILRADFAIYETYEYIPGRPLACPITVYGGYADEIAEEQLWAWAEQTTGEFSVEMFPGDHFFLNTAQNQLLQRLTQRLRTLMVAT
jgi:medium-chain acyl-[acyl-carrier-protein] hydrolase